MEETIIVDENDNIIGKKNRKEISSKDTVRVSILIIFDENKRMLLTQRAFTKKNHPGLWSLSVAGTNEVGETYESNIIKEAKEELDITINSLKYLDKEKIIEDKTLFASTFITRINSQTKIRIDKEEVNDAKWFTKEEFEKLVNKKPRIVTPGLALKKEKIIKLF